MQKKSSLKLAFSALAAFSLLALTACGGGSNSLTTDNLDSKDRIVPSKIGLNGEFDENGLAKRVAAALSSNSDLASTANIYVAQTGDTIILKGNAADRDTLAQIISVVRSVRGVGSVDTDAIVIR